MQQVKDALADDWAARLSGQQRLLMINQPPEPPTWHLIESWDAREQLQEIRGADGEPVLRYQSVSRAMPAVPPYIGFRTGAAGFGVFGRGFHVGGSGLYHQGSGPDISPEAKLARALALKDYWAAQVPTVGEMPEKVFLAQ